MPVDAEPILEPDLQIIDPHHHLWFVPESGRAAYDVTTNPYAHVRLRRSRYLLEELLADLHSGHNIRATMFVECHSMFKQDGPPELRSVGEIEFVNGVAAMGASGLYGDIQVCAGIIGNADLTSGDGVEPVLRAHMKAGGGRYRGIRHATQMDPDPALARVSVNRPGILLEPAFRQGFAWLGRLGLTFDAFLFEPQLPDLIDLARAFPDTSIVLNHTGTPLGLGAYAGRQAERLPIFRKNIRALAECPNVTVKLGGLGMPVCGFPAFLADPPATSAELADQWRPYIHACIEAFGAGRCMFESNFPTESGSCTYPVLWNAFKRLAAGASDDEKAQLFSGTAARIYRLDVL